MRTLHRWLRRLQRTGSEARPMTPNERDAEIRERYARALHSWNATHPGTDVGGLLPEQRRRYGAMLKTGLDIGTAIVLIETEGVDDA